MARFLITLGITIAMLAPASAAASNSQPGGKRAATSSSAPRAGAARSPVSVAVNIAKRYWGATPCDGSVTVLAGQPLTAGLLPTTDGWVTFQSSLGPNDLQAPAVSYTQCTISLARWQWPNRLEMASDWNMFCLTVIHEMGHLLGHPHSLVPGSVMAAVFVNESNVPTACRRERIRISRLVGLT